MPTGGGKTLCYAIPAIISKGVTIVVTPLLAPMDDQVKRLREQKMSVAYINSVMPEEEKDNVLHCLLQESIKYDVLYITPEALLTSQFQKVVERISKAGNLSRIIADEAHCVDTWGNNFRPSDLVTPVYVLLRSTIFKLLHLLQLPQKILHTVLSTALNLLIQTF